jgi:anti-sigma B factor antagonist
MSSFNVQIREEQNIQILELYGELDAHTAPELENRIKKLIDEEKHFIIVNFNSLDYISSAGLGVFMAYIEDVRALGGDIKLTNMKPSVYNVFDLLGFPTLYDILDDEIEAAQRFKSDFD